MSARLAGRRRPSYGGGQGGHGGPGALCRPLCRQEAAGVGGVSDSDFPVGAGQISDKLLSALSREGR